VIDTSKVPLSFIVGPTHDVWTTDEATKTWFADHLNSAPQLSAKRSCVGVLAEVGSQPNDSEKALGVTEVLFYTMSMSAYDTVGDGDPVFTIKAVPLCSGTASYLPSPPLSPRLSDQDLDAQLLPPREDLRAGALAKEKKRKQVSEVFDEATERRRKARRKGGESVAAAAASQFNGVNILTGHKKPKAPQRTQEQPADNAGNKPFPEQSMPVNMLRPRSRTGSISGYSHEQPHRVLSRSPSMSSEVRPASRRGPIDNISKRSSLSRVSSLTEAVSTEDRNKEAISRLVMAGMRLYGLQQRKKPNHSRRASEINGQVPQNPTPQDEEYKLIYHQTYKGAVLSFVSANS
jgi:hypothetical protein